MTAEMLRCYPRKFGHSIQFCSTRWCPWINNATCQGKSALQPSPRFRPGTKSPWEQYPCMKQTQYLFCTIQLNYAPDPTIGSHCRPTQAHCPESTASLPRAHFGGPAFSLYNEISTSTTPATASTNVHNPQKQKHNNLKPGNRLGRGLARRSCEQVFRLPRTPFWLLPNLVDAVGADYTAVRSCFNGSDAEFR
jgi:hypothetical protein